MQLSGAFFIARRPVLDARQQPVGHDLVFHVFEDDPLGQGAIPDPASGVGSAGPALVEDICRQDVLRLLGDLPAVLQPNEAALMSDALLQLPQHRIMLALRAQAPLPPPLLEQCERLARAGYRFVLETDGIEELPAALPPANLVRIDIRDRPVQVLETAVSRVRAGGQRLCAANVDHPDQFRQCSALGFDSFQGYFFAVPEVGDVKAFAPTQQSIVEMLGLLAADADDALLERHIKSDLRLGLNLLRLANSPAFTSFRINSLRQALMVLGRNTLQHWLQMLLYAEAGGGGIAVQALGSLAATRARLMELVAQQLTPGNRGVADTAFTVGIMSLMDTLFGMTMEDILRQLPVVDEVKEALLHRRGFHGSLLALAMDAETLRDPLRLLEQTRALRLSSANLYLSQLSAFEWSDQVTRSLRAPN